MVQDDWGWTAASLDEAGCRGVANVAGGRYRITRVQVPVSWIKGAAVVLVAGWAGWLFLLWQPARQVERHTLNLLKRASDRDWAAVESMMAPDYRDAWNADRAAAIAEARQLFSHFFALQITALEPLQIEETGGVWQAAGPVGIFGSGTAVAHAVMEEVRAAEGPFVFRWRKSGTWPWEWSLTATGHEGLDAKYGAYLRESKGGSGVPAAY